ncbi:hypothetical protein CARUB_v10014476mg [Capsella rubella]|uniref:Uncharacterized protein n=1 Tax=Capsella rubella TaxID=81985 RepID=R0G6Q2_9BRAS|nr:hypothetical protein CARUB_v10014476mg [Capsella rubella]EOA31303.1 hypothetical protein CARUB_v10014476mg [Capsella rubella]
MELSAEIQSSGLRKRKAEDDGGSTQSPLDSSGDLEYDDDDLMEEEGDGEASDVSSREEGQEWDVDSFDDGFDYRPKRNLDPNDEIGQKMHLYRSQMYRSKGFHVDRENYPGSVMYRPLVPIDLDKPFWNTGLTGRPFMQNMVDLALERYNRIKFPWRPESNLTLLSWLESFRMEISWSIKPRLRRGYGKGNLMSYFAGQLQNPKIPRMMILSTRILQVMRRIVTRPAVEVAKNGMLIVLTINPNTNSQG